MAKEEKTEPMLCPPCQGTGIDFRRSTKENKVRCGHCGGSGIVTDDGKKNGHREDKVK